MSALDATSSALDNLPVRVAALELLVEQLILERVQITEDPSAAVRMAMGRLTQMASKRASVPREAASAIISDDQSSEVAQLQTLKRINTR